MPVLTYKLTPGLNPHEAAVLRINLLGPDLLAKRGQLSATAQAEAIGISTGALAGITSGTTNPQCSTVTACLKWLAANS